MSAEKTVSVSFRMSRDLKAVIEAVAAMENRSITNMFETLVLNHCQRERMTTNPHAPRAKAERKR
jgi:hypothetical protein